MELAEPQIMGILNVTPDSFFAASRREDETAIVERARQIVDEGALVIDVGGCSTRPGSEPATEEEEKARLGVALKAIRRELPDALLSVDTFRPRVAEWAVGEYGVGLREIRFESATGSDTVTLTYVPGDGDTSGAVVRACRRGQGVLFVLR